MTLTIDKIADQPVNQPFVVSGKVNRVSDVPSLQYRDVTAAGYSLPTFNDEFASFALSDPRNPAAQSIWAPGETNSPDGRGGPNWAEHGTQWWTNPFNPSTPISGLYTNDGTQTLLAVLPTPAAYQTYIDAQAGAPRPFVGCLMNSSPSCEHVLGYWECTVTVDRVPGFAFQFSIKAPGSFPIPPEFAVNIGTNGRGVQSAGFSCLKQDGTRAAWTPDAATGFDPRESHRYGFDWLPTSFNGYIDGTLVWTVHHGGYPYDGSVACQIHVLTATNYGYADVDPAIASLPCYARLANVRWFAGGFPVGAPLVLGDFQNIPSDGVGTIRAKPGALNRYRTYVFTHPGVAANSSYHLDVQDATDATTMVSSNTFAVTGGSP